MELLNNEKAPVSNQTSKQSVAVEDVLEGDNMGAAMHGKNTRVL